MKRISSMPLGVCLAAVIGIVFGPRPAAAQMVDLITVKLPYAATVGKVTLPAGEYTIRDLKTDGSSPVLEIRSITGSGVSAIATHISARNRKESEQTEVILRHEGNKYQIDKIWLQGRDFGYDLHPAAPREK